MKINHLINETTGVTDYNPKSQGGTRKELLAKYHKTKDPKDAEAARKAGATQSELKGEKLDEISRGDYYKKATINKAAAEMGAGFARSPEEREKNLAIAGRREKGLARAKARSDKWWAEKQAKDKAEREQAIRDKFAGVDIDAELAKLQPAIDRAYSDYQYGDRRTWSQGKAEYDRLMGMVRELENAKKLLSEEGKGLWANIHAKQERIKHGSGERMRKPGSKGAPTAQNFKDAASESVEEGFDEEYDDEAGMAETNLHTIIRAAEELLNTIDDHENLPEWVQEKIAKVEGMITSAEDYLQSQEEEGVNEGFALNRVRDKLGDQGYIGTQDDRKRERERHREYMDRLHQSRMDQQDRHDRSDDAYNDYIANRWKHATQQSANNVANQNKHQQMNLDRWEQMEEGMERGVDAKGRTQDQWIKAVYKQFPDARIVQAKMIDGPCHAMLPDGRKLSWTKVEQPVAEGSPAWQKKAGKNKNGGLNAKGVASYRREHPGSKLQTAVTTKPSKLKPGSKAAKRRKSFCARMSGMPGPMKDDNGKPTRKALSLKKWNC